MIKAIIHNSDSPQGRGDNAATIHKWHLERGFDGIGYHYVILEDGTVEAGRPHYWKGAHTKGHNEALGVCLIGESNFTAKQYKALSELLDTFKFKDEEIVGHNSIDETKTCPNFNLALFLEFRMMLKV